MILSTHIVSDVSDLCRAMAILHGGRVLVTGEPTALVEQLNGRVWQRIVPQAEVTAYRERLDVISVRLFAGRNLVRLLGDHQPGPQFEPVSPDLEDLYFVTIKGLLGEGLPAAVHQESEDSSAGHAN